MTKTLAKWAAIVVIAFGLVMAGTAIGGAFAQDTNKNPSTATKPSTDPATPPGKPSTNPGKGERKSAGKAFKASLFNQTAELTGLKNRDVIAKLREGQSLSEIAAANGSSEQAVIDAALAKVGERLDKAVANGRISADEKDSVLEEARKAAPGLMQEKGLQAGRGGAKSNAKGERGGRQILVKATAEVTGLTADQVRAEVKAGKSLEQIAKEHGKTADDIVAWLRTKAEERLNKELDHARDAITKVPGK